MCSGGCPRKSIHLKKFRALVDPSGIFPSGYNSSSNYGALKFTCNSKARLRIKRVLI